jgi:eukaryotic-like serine/threonine-protein kinase
MKTEQLGPYRLGRTLGRGGMGAVYEGVNVETDEPAAVKVLSAALAGDSDFRQRFAIEIETLRKLYHPNIVQLFGFGEQDGVLFYAMELVNGSSLEAELRGGRVFAWREVAEIGIQTCRALRHAHDRGIIHRDIKPANLLLTKDGKVKLSDFGIARLFGNTRVTAVGNVLGTVEYMAPEQADGRPVTPRTDLYSLGGMLYCLLTRRTPFQAQSLVEMLQKHRTAQPDPIGRFARDVPEEMELIVYQLLAKDPEKRIANATLVARRLEAMVRALSVIPNTVERQDIRRLRQESEPEAVAKPAAKPTAKPTAKPAAALSPSPPSATPPESLASPASPFSHEIPETRLLPQADSRLPDSGAPTRAIGQGDEELAETAADSLLWNRGAAAKNGRASPQLGPQPGPVPVGEGIDDGLSMDDDSGWVPPSGERAVAGATTVTGDGPPTSTGHFVTVAEEDLDRHDNEPAPHPLVSVSTWILAGTLLVTGLTAWYLLQPPSVETLYGRIATAAADGKIGDARSDVDEFLHRYSDDPRSREVWQYQRTIDLDDLKRRLEIRVRTESGRRKLLPIETAAIEALRETERDPKRALTKFQAMLLLYRDKPDLSKEAGDCLDLARREIEELRQRPEKDDGNSFSAELDERLRHADLLQSTDPDAARAIRQAIVELYQDKPWAAAAVQQARKALDAEPAEKQPAKN